jgi:hypothetical protein
MRECSCEDEQISHIEESGIFRKFFADIVPEYSENSKNRDDLEDDSFYRQRESDSVIV